MPSLRCSRPRRMPSDAQKEFRGGKYVQRVQFIFIHFHFAWLRTPESENKVHNFFSKVRAWPFTRSDSTAELRQMSWVDESALFHVNFKSLKSFSREWSQRHNFPRLGLRFTRFCPLIDVVHILWLLLTCSLTQRFVVKRCFINMCSGWFVMSV